MKRKIWRPTQDIITERIPRRLIEAASGDVLRIFVAALGRLVPWSIYAQLALEDTGYEQKDQLTSGEHGIQDDTGTPNVDGLGRIWPVDGELKVLKCLIA